MWYKWKQLKYQTCLLIQYSHYDFHKKLLSLKEVFLRVDINVSSAVEFQRWWVLKSKIFGPESKYLKDFFLNLSMNVSLSKIGHDFSNKVVQKLMLEKKCF